MKVYYNEFDKKKCAMLSQLMKDGHISKGDIDDRSIRDVRGSEIKEYERCHFFAGIGLWDYALNLAGWEEDRPVWTGSCPCQPFSTAGRQKGKADDRHLWPEWLRLIEECSPATIFGEQVANAVTKGWLDDVIDDLGEIGHSVIPAVIPASAVGAPHRRDRLWFVGFNDKLHCNTPHNDILFSNEENLQKMWSKKGFREFREEERIKRRTAVSVSTVPEQVSSGIPSKEQGCAYRVCPPNTEGQPPETQRLCEKIQADEQGSLFNCGYEEKVKTEENPIRFRQIRKRDTSKDRDGDLRNDWNKTTHILQKDKGLRHAIIRPHRPREGLCLREHQNSLLGNERGHGDVGGECTFRNIREVEEIDDIQILHNTDEEIAGTKPMEQSPIVGDENYPERKVFPENENLNEEGAPHKRNRLWFVGHAEHNGQLAHAELRCHEKTGNERGPEGQNMSGESKRTGAVGNAQSLSGRASGEREGVAPESVLGNASGEGSQGHGGFEQEHGSEGREAAQRYPWQTGVWIDCPDGKQRLVEPRISLLASGYPERVAILHAAGDAIVPNVAAEFIQAFQGG